MILVRLGLSGFLRPSSMLDAVIGIDTIAGPFPVETSRLLSMMVELDRSSAHKVEVARVTEMQIEL